MIKTKNFEDVERIRLKKEHDDGQQLIREGKFVEGMKKVENGRLIGIFGNNHIGSPFPIYDGTQNLKNKTIILSCEGALGDEIMHLRFAEDLYKMGAKVILLCHQPVSRLAARQKYINCSCIHEHGKGIFHDYWVPAYSLPVALGYDYSNMPNKPYLEIPEEFIQKWKIINDKEVFKVGIRWQGANISDKHALRDIPVPMLMKLTEIPNTQFYSLQRDSGVELLPKNSNVIDLSNMIDTLEDTAAAIMNLDLVISSCTLIPHIAGAIGKKTWVVLNSEHFHLWSYPGNGTTPWYESVKLFTAKKLGMFDGVFNMMYELLNEEVKNHFTKN